ncbi:MAG: hypothetical protein COA63_014160 [Methylophaga sp.]|nr:hypothetical protein [Methylophaga sp.]
MVVPRWQNIAAPNFGDVSSLLSNASSSWNRAFDRADKGFNSFRKSNQEEKSNAVIADLARVGSEGDIEGFLSNLNINSADMTPELAQSIANIRGTAQGYDTNRLNQGGISARTNATRNRDSRDQTSFSRGIHRENSQSDLLLAGLAPESLVGSESGGNFKAKNNATGSSGRKGHFGRVQFGKDRFDEAIRAGAIPRGMSPEQFLNNPAVQRDAEAWHFGDIGKRIDEKNLMRYEGKVINGTPMTRDGMIAVAHLGGFGGLQKYLSSNGNYNPTDGHTRLSDYAKQHAGSSTVNRPNTPPQQSGFNTAVRRVLENGGLLSPADVTAVRDATIGADNKQRAADDLSRSRDQVFEQNQYKFSKNSQRDEQVEIGRNSASGYIADSIDADQATRKIQNSDMSPEAKAEALNQVNSYSFDAPEGTGYSLEELGLKGFGGIEQDISEQIATHERDLSKDVGVRLASVASSSDDKYTVLQGLYSDSKLEPAQISSAYESIEIDLKEAGINTTPAEIVQLMKESISDDNWFGGLFGSDFEADKKKAVRLAKDYLTEDGRKATTNIANKSNSAIQNLNRIKTRFDKVKQNLTNGHYRGKSLERQQKLYKKLYNELLALADNR